MKSDRPMFCQNPTDPIEPDCPDCVDAVIERAREYERRLKLADAVVDASRRLHCDLIPNHYAECETPGCGGACEDAIVKAIKIYDAASKK